jgi:L-seryl-tRNA(Ser) seleniumtransferase
MQDGYGPGLAGEPTAQRALADGADLVTFSGDKLLGGPQAGIVLGRADLVERVRRHPLMRALRPGKLDLAALEATLELWRDGRVDEIPVARMLGLAPRAAKARAILLARRVRAARSGWEVAVRPVEGRAGGGSLPLGAAPGFAVALGFPSASPDRVEAALRGGDPPVIARIVDDRVLLDLRTVLPEDEGDLLRRLVEAGEALGTPAAGR